MFTIEKYLRKHIRKDKNWQRESCPQANHKALEA